MNVIIADDVSGSVSLKLRGGSWKEALEAVLSLHKLGYERQGNIFRVAKLENLRDEARQRASVAAARTRSAPLTTLFIQVNHARASDLLPHVQALLSPRGTASVDARTNVIIVRDVETFEAGRFDGR